MMKPLTVHVFKNDDWSYIVKTIGRGGGVAVHFSTAIKQMPSLYPLPFCFDPTLDSCGLFTCAYSLPVRPFDETHGTCCPFPFKERSRAEQHTATCHLDLLFDSAKAASMFIPHCFVSRAVVCSLSFLHSLPFSFFTAPFRPTNSLLVTTQTVGFLQTPSVFLASPLCQFPYCMCAIIY